ncbi:hypothetical protein N7450_008724 [Penicillium hetheringtonii]|uniref:Zn(2)-C6 fungal-type domain-containing protein n=1 Tax=Penicillium hetheringtonii TaxID=911720 RepID=A0AAD6DDQ4_9EURO|nr:hypothetical protein N7450_008724 [Penicillium hetheringtonii]
MGPRRTHRKSRNGCPECKSRRLKCDERYPCTNCAKHAIHCSYVGPTEGHIATPASSISPAAQPQPQPKPGFQAQVYSNTSPQAMSTIPGYNEESIWGLTSADIALDSEDRWDILEALPNAPNTDDWGLDLELMHHYCTVTCNTMSIREDARHVWRVIIPMEGYSNKYLMHGLLAVAALHKAYLYSNQRTKYIKAAAQHLAVGLKEFRELVASPVDPENWQPVFLFASMISVHLSVVPLRLGADKWPDPIFNMVELFSSIKGFQAIMKPFLRSLRKTQLAPLVNSIFLEDEMFIPSPSVVSQSLLPPGMWEQIDKLQKFLEEYQFPNSNPATSPILTTPEYRGPLEDYKVAIDFFKVAARQIELAGPHVETGMVYMWAYPLSKRIHNDMKSYQPAALVLLAHYCVLLKLVESYWYISDLGCSLLEDIESHMHADFRDWLEWPRRWVFGKSSRRS